MYTITDLFDLSHTMAKDYFSDFTYPWEALPGIKDMILALGAALDKEEYDEVSITLNSIIYNSVTEHTPDEVNIYVIDCGAEIYVPDINDTNWVARNQAYQFALNNEQKHLKGRLDE